MSGFGERFRRASYQMPKPLIEVDGIPIIEHLVNMFLGEKDFLFICNEDHLDETSYKMREFLNRICPTGSIVGIPQDEEGGNGKVDAEEILPLLVKLNVFVKAQ